MSEKQLERDEWARRLLDDCADLFEDGHWTKHQEGDGKGNHCAVGAMKQLAMKQQYPKNMGIVKRAKQLLRSALPSHRYEEVENNTDHQRIIGWNDSRRNADEVIETFRKAAKK